MIRTKICMLIVVALLIMYMVFQQCKYSRFSSDYEFDKPDHSAKKCVGQVKKDYLNSIKVIDNFLTDAECDHVIKLAEPRVRRSTVMASNNDEVSNYRTSDNVFISKKEDSIIRAISERVNRFTGIPIAHQEDIQILRYKEGKYYKPHYDACLDDTKNCKQDQQLRGTRINTALVYLSDTIGGETSFNNLGEKFTPKKGMAIFFNPVIKTTKGYEHHPCSYHAALPVIKGEKYNLTVWSRDKPQPN
jgi:prolyl 4-hydroxylase